MLRRALVAAALVLALVGAARAQEVTPPHQEWSFYGLFGTFDRASAQRGLQVYKEVCAACHPVSHLHFRDLADLGYDEDQLKAIAATYQVTDGPNDQGKMFQRPGRPSDPIPGPFPNEQAARAANGGALPPDLSMIVKARDGGPDYVYALVGLGFKNPPQGMKMMEGRYYNEYFPGHQIAMPPPLSEGAVKFADGTPATVPQMAHDAVTFLTWAAEPNLEDRHRVGFKVVLFLIVGVIVFYAAKRKIWAGLH